MVAAVAASSGVGPAAAGAVPFGRRVSGTTLPAGEPAFATCGKGAACAGAGIRMMLEGGRAASTGTGGSGVAAEPVTGVGAACGVVRAGTAAAGGAGWVWAGTGGGAEVVGTALGVTVAGG